MTTDHEPQGDPGRLTLGPIRGRSVSVAIVERIAELEGLAPDELEPLSHRIDPESVDRLVRSTDARDGSGGFRLSFRYEGYDVTVRNPATVEISAADGADRDDA